MSVGRTVAIELCEVTDPDLRSLFEPADKVILDVVGRAHCRECDAILAEIIRTNREPVAVVFEPNHKLRDAYAEVADLPPENQVRKTWLQFHAPPAKEWKRPGYPRWISEVDDLVMHHCRA